MTSRRTWAEPCSSSGKEATRLKKQSCWIKFGHDTVTHGSELCLCSRAAFSFESFAFQAPCFTCVFVNFCLKWYFLRNRGMEKEWPKIENVRVCFGPLLMKMHASHNICSKTTCLSHISHRRTSLTHGTKSMHKASLVSNPKVLTCILRVE